MKDMEREKFEQSWKDALDEATVSPSETVWTNIELELEKAKGGELKKRLFFYKMLAAASVVFAMAIAGTGYYVNVGRTGPVSLVAETDTSPRTSGTPDSESLPKRDDTQVDATEMIASAQPPSLPDEAVVPEKLVQKDAVPDKGQADATDQSGDASRPETYSGKREGTEQFQTARAGVGRNDETHLGGDLPGSLSERALPPLYQPRDITLTLPATAEETIDPVAAMMARLAAREREMRGEEETEEEDRNDENFWTSVGFAAGSVNSIASAATSGAGARTMALAAPIVEQETKASGYTYSMGINVGTRLSDRWVLQGGVNYLTQATEYTADNVVLSASAYQQRFHPATTNELIKSNALDLGNKIVYSAPYNVNNSMRYISIPMQAGYMLIQKTFGLQLNAGVATDLFLQNTIETNSNQIDKTTQGSGADSPYRTVNLSGLFGTEVSYRFSENYRVSLNPGVRYPLNTIYKSELGVDSTPLTFDIGLRFRYIFH